VGELMSNVETISTGYYPRPLQDQLHRTLKRFNVIFAHRRFGKSIFSVNEMVHQGLSLDKFNPQYAYIAPTYSQAKRIIWDVLKQYTQNIPGVTYNEAELRCDIPRPHRNDRIRIYLLGAENPDTVRGMFLDGCIFDEFDDMNFSIWATSVRPLLTDRLGWAIFIGTPKGRKHLYKLYEEASLPGNEDSWHRMVYRASETEIIPRSELEAAKRGMSEEEYAQEFECSWDAANVGSYYAKYMTKALNEGRFTNVPYNRGYAVDTFWDIGIGDTTAIWFRQRIAGREHFIDHLETSGMGLDHYINELVKKGYVYGEHVFPHDMEALEFGTGRTRIDMFREWSHTSGLGGRSRVIAKSKVDDGINAVRMILDQCWFDTTKCHRGLEALKSYTKKYDEKNQVFSEKPKHDWASHSADAFRTFAMGKRDHSESFTQERLTEEQIMADHKYDIFNYGTD
jgi:phage terminase large subunit